MIAGVLEIQMMANMARLSDDMRRAERVVGDSMGKVEHSVAKAGKAMSSLGLGLSGALIADQMRRAVDAYTKIDAQLRLSTKSQQQYNQALADVRRISGVAQSDISATTMLYTRLLNVMDGTGVSQGKLATVTETVSYGLKAFGATSAEAASASLQLSQAMGANRLGGEEFRAVMEAMPNVMKVLATSMGVPIGELRALSIAGKITAAEMVKAFGDPAVAAEFKRLALNAQTITGAWTQVRNEFIMLFGEFAKQSGVTAATIASFKLLADSMRVLGQYMGDLVMIFGAWAALRVAQMIYGYVAALAASRAATLAAAQAELVRMNMTYGASAASVAATRTAYAQAAANTTVAGSLVTMGRAMMAFALANAPMLALLALAAAVVTLKNSFQDSINPTGKFIEQIRGMGLEALIAARQMEEFKLANMWFKDSFNERDRRATEDRIRMLNAQIIAEKKLSEIEIKPVKAGGVGGEKDTAYQQLLKDWDDWNAFQNKKYDAEHAQIAKLAEERKKQNDAIAGSLIASLRAADPARALMDDIESALTERVLKVKVSAAVDATMESAGKAFDSLLIAVGMNTAAVEKNTAESSSSGDWIMAIVMAIYYGFAIGEQKREAGRRTELLGGRAGITSGATAIDWEQSRGWFEAPKVWSESVGISLAQLNKFTAQIGENNYVYSEAGDMLGYLNARTQDYAIDINTAGDATDALTNSIGRSLLPAIIMFRQEGETLSDTATRLTGVFRATNDLIVALGVSQGTAFGGFGLGSTQGRQALIDASGGLQQFTQNAQSFVSKFLTPAEQLAPALDEVGRTFAQLGIQGVSTNEQFADLVKQQMELGNTDVVAQLLSVADSFDAVTKSAADANKELTALLRKELFSTLTDYIRATNAGGAASGLIAGAISGASAIMGQEAAGTAGFALANAGVIGAQNAALVTNDFPGEGNRGGHSQWEFFTDWLTKLWELFIDWLDHLWITLRDWIEHLWTVLRDFGEQSFVALRDLPGNIFIALRDAFDHLFIVIRDAIVDGISGLTEGMGISGLWGGGGQAIGGGLNPLNWATGGAFGSSGIHAFANGAAFTNGIYNTPTPFMFANGAGFSQGIMGEAGDEAIMPLERGADGRLGVSMNSGGGLVAEVRMLRASVERMDANNTSGNIAISTATQRTYKVIDRWNGEGMPEVRTT